MTLLSVRGLSVRLGAAPVVSDLSFDLARGGVLGVVGESGSGKSVTALAIAGLLPDGMTARGSVRLEGDELLGLGDTAMSRRRGSQIGMVFQEPMTALNPLHTIGDQVAEPIRLHGRLPRREALDRAAGVLARVGLPRERFSLSLYPHQLSGGQRQRVAIAAAISAKPRLLIADEPTTALDVTTQGAILSLIRGLVAEDGMGLVLITHDLAVVAGLAGEIVVMRAGRAVAQGPTEAVFRGGESYVRSLVAATCPARRKAAAPPGAPLLSVDRATRDYPLPRPSPFAARPVRRALDAVSIELCEGESLGLVGASGSGKSTLARAILGLEALQSGVVRLAGRPVGPGMERAFRRHMQAVFQDPYGSFDPRWRVARLVAEPFHLTGRPPDAAERIAAALTEVGLQASDAGRFIHEFSGGQRQRIAIARALIARPKLIVLDEAVSALDVRVRAQVLELLAGLRAAHGLSYLFISHDLSVVRAVTDRVVVLDAGRIVEAGPTEAVLAAPRHPVTRALVAAMPRLPEGWATA
ncbi:MAG: dipeptide ABC transporter ATP-binding protein [Paracoccaceae bacterium]